MVFRKIMDKNKKQLNKEIKDQIKVIKLDATIDNNAGGAFYLYYPPYDKDWVPAITKTESFKLINGNILNVDFNLDSIVGLEVIPCRNFTPSK